MPLNHFGKYRESGSLLKNRYIFEKFMNFGEQPVDVNNELIGSAAKSANPDELKCDFLI